MRNRFGVCLAVVFLSQVAFADKVSDFKDAVGQVGCDSIPYGDFRGTCRSQQAEIHPWCDGDRGPGSCTANVTRDLKGKLDREQQNLSALKDKRHDADDKRYHATDDADRAKWQSEMDATDKAIDTSQREVDRLRDELSKRKDLVGKTIDTLNRCINYRQAVMNVYSDARSMARSESDDDVRPYARQLLEKWASQIEGHDQQIKEKSNAVATCRGEQP